MIEMMGLKIENVKAEKGIEMIKDLPLQIKMLEATRCLCFPARISILENLLMNLTFLTVSVALPATVFCQKMYAVLFL